MGVKGKTLFQIDNTIRGAIIRLARLETDRIFASLGPLPPNVPEAVLDKILEFFNLSFV